MGKEKKDGAALLPLRSGSMSLTRINGVPPNHYARIAFPQRNMITLHSLPDKSLWKHPCEDIKRTASRTRA